MRRSKDVKVMHANDFVVGPLWYVSASKSKAERDRAKLMNLCMEGKGYTAVEER